MTYRRLPIFSGSFRIFTFANKLKRDGATYNHEFDAYPRFTDF